MTRTECVDGMQRIIDEDRNKILVRVHVGYLIHAVKYLKDQPEVVRCKDCKYWSAERINDFNKCRRWINVGVKNFATMSEWFCADGKRMDDDG